MTRTHLPVLGLIATILVSAGFAAHQSGEAGDPVPIAGGTFEASGAAHVPSTTGVLFVDDGRTREVFWLPLNRDGSQLSAAMPIALGADVTDPEGITSDGQLHYVVGSQSKTSGFVGDGLVRFRFDPETRAIDRVEAIRGLKKWLAEQVAELEGTATRVGDAVLNIEGLAWDPHRYRLLLGLRAPVIDGQALIIALTLRDRSKPFTIDNLTVEGGKAIRLPLAGAGIRSIEFDAVAGAFRIITGSGVDDETRDFRVVEWSGEGTAVREVARFPRRLKPEGITRTTIDGRPRTVIVFDTGRYTLMN